MVGDEDARMLGLRRATAGKAAVPPTTEAGEERFLVPKLEQSRAQRLLQPTCGMVPTPLTCFSVRSHWALSNERNREENWLASHSFRVGLQVCSLTGELLCQKSLAETMT